MGLELKIADRLHGTGGWFDINIKLSMPSSAIIGIYGDSGSGKTTILRSIAGLHHPNKILLTLNDEDWVDSEKKLRLSHKKRSMSMVFQDNALYPHMSIEENIQFACREDNKAAVDEIISVLGLQEIMHRKPQALSGGQLQRVSLARALVNKPDILLLDEPLSALDKQSRADLQELIATHHERIGAYTFLVSHDIEELEKLSDHIFQLKDGVLVAHTSLKKNNWKLIQTEETENGVVAVIERNGKKLRLKE